MRVFLRFLFGFFFVLTMLSAIFLSAFKLSFLNYGNMKARLAKHKVYARVYEAIPEITNLALGNAEGQEGADGGPALSGDQLGRVITGSFTPLQLSETADSFLAGFYGWVYGQGPEIPQINLSTFKPKMEALAATQLNVPVELIRSGGAALTFPEKIEIEPVPSLLLLRKIVTNFGIVITSLVLISLLLLTAVILTADDGPSSYVKRPITPLWITGILVALIAGLNWLFFNAGNLLTKMVGEQLGSSPKTMTVAEGFLRSLINDFSNTLLIFSAFLIIPAIILGIISGILKKRELRVFQKNQEKK